MYTLQLQVNKSFGAKHLRTYTYQISANIINEEHIVNWIVYCLNEYRETVLKNAEILDILMLNMVREIKVIRKDNKVIISTSPELYVDLWSLANCLLKEINQDYQDIVTIYNLVDGYLHTIKREGE